MGKTVLDKHAVWICSFALPQNQNIGAVLSSNIQDSPFARALLAAQRIVLAVDAKVEPLERSWCCYELFLAVTNGKRLDIRAPLLSRTLFQCVVDKVGNLDIRNCSASNEDDHRRIMEVIAGAEDLVNEQIQDEVKATVKLMNDVQD